MIPKYHGILKRNYTVTVIGARAAPVELNFYGQKKLTQKVYVCNVK